MSSARRATARRDGSRGSAPAQRRARPRADGRPAPPDIPRRVAIEDIRPIVDGGRFAIKRTEGEPVVVEADVFAEGHDLVAASLRWRRADEPAWNEVPMHALGNDRWRGEFTCGKEGAYRYSVMGWVDRFGTWRRDLEKRIAAGQDVSVEVLIGAEFVERASGLPGAGELERWAARLKSTEDGSDALDPALAALMTAHPEREFATESAELPLVVDRERARFSSWYELFPRSTSPEPDRHGTFADVERRLEYVARLGFDVVYFPPIHPIGPTKRKGRNNSPDAQPGEPGSPWGIGSEEGGHTAVHPDLGTIEDFEHMVGRARELGLEVALDVAFQTSPDHPWVREHPQWFRHRPDGTIQYAENPPKKYQDIYPIDFETDDWRALWDELKGVFDFWIARGVRIFRVDNPHTKPFPFWEWLIGEIKAHHPDVLFLSEAFTRPRPMHRLAKVGFTMSYTYFTWRNSKAELTEYFTELTKASSREYFRPHLWPNTPDILHATLQKGGRGAFAYRYVLATTLGAGYGIYGPAFELAEGRPLHDGSEEYWDSEKYQIRHWDLDRPGSLAPLIATMNRVRRENPALQSDWSLRFHEIDNDQLLVYSKATPDKRNVILVVVNLDPQWRQSGWVRLSLEDLGVEIGRPYYVVDLLSGARFVWTGPRNYVELNPALAPAHVFRLQRPE
jgi:starch synthase (maltosyl-transferring)